MEKEKLKKHFSSRIGELIDDLKDLKGISLKQQAEQLGINFGTLAKYKRGELLPVADVIHKMAEYYNVSADYLLCLSNSKSVKIDNRIIADKLKLNDWTIDRLLDPIMTDKYSKYNHNTIIDFLFNPGNYTLLWELARYWSEGITEEEKEEKDRLLHKYLDNQISKNEISKVESRIVVLREKKKNTNVLLVELIEDIQKAQKDFLKWVEKNGKSEKN